MFVVTGSDQKSDCWVHLWDYCDLLLWKWTSGRRSCCWGRMAAVRCSQLKLYTLKFMQISQYVKIQVIYKIILVQLLWIFISHGFGFCEGLHTIHYVSASLVIFMFSNWPVYVSGRFKSNYPDLRCNHTAELWLLSLAGNYCCKDIYTCAKFHRGDTVASLGAQISPQNHHWNNKAAHGPTFLLKLC